MSSSLQRWALLTPPPALKTTHLQDLLTRYILVRRFLPTLLTTLRLQVAPGGVDVLQALKALRDINGRCIIRAQDVPMALATGPWSARTVGLDGC